MTIRNIESFVASLPDWAILDGCFGCTRIKPSDIDGCVERNGRCLFLEHKREPAILNRGQERLFEALVKQGNTVIVHWTVALPSGEQSVYAMRVMHGDDLGVKKAASIEQYRAAVASWFKWTNDNPSQVP